MIVCQCDLVEDAADGGVASPQANRATVGSGSSDRPDVRAVGGPSTKVDPSSGGRSQGHSGADRIGCRAHRVTRPEARTAVNHVCRARCRRCSYLPATRIQSFVVHRQRRQKWRDNLKTGTGSGWVSGGIGESQRAADICRSGGNRSVRVDRFGSNDSADVAGATCIYRSQLHRFVCRHPAQSRCSW